MHSILVPVDLSDATPSILRTAGELAGAFRCKVHVLHVYEREAAVIGSEFGALPSTAAIIASELDARRREVERTTQQLTEQGIDASPLFVDGDAIDSIVDQARRVSADLIVLGSHGHGALYHLLMGSVSTGVMRKAHCPVVVVPVRAGKPAPQPV